MFKRVLFSVSHELVKFLNDNEIEKSDIVNVLVFGGVIILIYFDPEGEDNE